jgi:macrolide transport system ATP-binding/permease protein
MRLLTMRDVRVGFPQRDLFHIDKLEVFSGEKIGLIGANGAGKSTLFRVLTDDLDALEGTITTEGEWQLFRQFDDAHPADRLDDRDLAFWQLEALWQRGPETLSGGEKTRSRLSGILNTPGDMLLLDEPTSHLDLWGIQHLSNSLYRIESFILVSHDRVLLNEHCTRIWDIREGTIVDFPGNYDDYQAWLAMDLKRRAFEYEAYQEEKKRLKSVVLDYKTRAGKIDRKPKNMSYSEARQRDFTTSRRSYQGRSKSLHAAAKHTQKRLEQLEEKEPPERLFTIRPSFELTNPPKNKIIAEAEHLSFGFQGFDLLFSDTSFRLLRNKKTALLGPNGCGKSVFCELLVKGHPAIRSVPKARYGYFRQEMDLIDETKSVLDNMRAISCQSEEVNRSVLARMGFFRHDVNKQASLLSGGEKIRLSFAMLFVSDANVLVLDEPTNFLDLPSLEAIENMLLDYEGTMLFVSHDRQFIDRLADERWTIAGGRLIVMDSSD